VPTVALIIVDVIAGLARVAEDDLSAH